ncbi:hypothetical protein Q3G72_025586 [Acer saccharum]|nr:hypothetical protein Q3G72_025586 [Acer saccharum]
MSTTASGLIVPSKYSTAQHIYTCSCHRFQSVISNPARFSVMSKHRDKFDFLIRNPPLRSFNVKDVVVVYSSTLPEPPLVPNSDPSPQSWKIWILGMVISVILPFWRNKWGSFQRLKNEVEAEMETAEHVAEIVEDVAEKVEKVAEEVADHLPQGGRLKDAVTLIENVAKETAKDAHLADQFIEKVEDVEREVESFSVINQNINRASQATKE